MATATTYPETLVEPRGIAAWLTTVDHKRIGIMYTVTAFIFFTLGGLLALIVRLELALPGAQIVTAEQYNRVFSMHGTTMIFLFVIPIFVGFGNYIIPLQIGARDMAFPRLNALSYWLLLAGGIILYSSFLPFAGFPANAGWTNYVPLSAKAFSPQIGDDLWLIGLTVLGF